MCFAGCGALYEEGKPLEEITCRCGFGYWDIFQQKFVPGADVRKGNAPSRTEYEKVVKQSFDQSEEYIARLREQWIIHFNTCAVKKATEEAIRQEGGIVDTSTAERSALELKEINEKGDFISRGLSMSKVPGEADDVDEQASVEEEGSVRRSESATLKFEAGLRVPTYDASDDLSRRVHRSEELDED